MVLSYVRIDVILYKVTKYLSNYKILDYNIFFIKGLISFTNYFFSSKIYPLQSYKKASQKGRLFKIILLYLLLSFRGLPLLLLALGKSVHFVFSLKYHTKADELFHHLPCCSLPLLSVPYLPVSQTH